ncbi:hypothetical protein B0H13DRAFT_2361256 [Mycena leptocephala]|nr:hypothetical protein B0H13DRAFT_2361256 [Mycena leptocephala]
MTGLPHENYVPVFGVRLQVPPILGNGSQLATRSVSRAHGFMHAMRCYREPFYIRSRSHWRLSRCSAAPSFASSTVYLDRCTQWARSAGLDGDGDTVYMALGPFAIAFLTYGLRTLLSAMRASARRCRTRSHERTTMLVSLLNLSPRSTPLDTSPRLSFHLNRVARRCPTFLPRLRSKSFPVSSPPCPSILALTRERSEEISGGGKALPKLGFGAGRARVVCCQLYAHTSRDKT